MKRQAKQIAIDSITNAIHALEMISAEDVKNRRSAKKSRKPKWTKSIYRLRFLLRTLKATRRETKKIGGRV